MAMLLADIRLDQRKQHQEVTEQKVSQKKDKTVGNLYGIKLYFPPSILLFNTPFLATEAGFQQIHQQVSNPATNMYMKYQSLHSTSPSTRTKAGVQEGFVLGPLSSSSHCTSCRFPVWSLPVEWNIGRTPMTCSSTLSANNQQHWFRFMRVGMVYQLHVCMRGWHSGLVFDVSNWKSWDLTVNEKVESVVIWQLSASLEQPLNHRPLSWCHPQPNARIRQACYRSQQLVVNVWDGSRKAAVITGHSRFNHITPVPAGLHWLPVRSWIMLKTVTLTYKIRQCGQQTYLASSSRRNVQYAICGLLL